MATFAELYDVQSRSTMAAELLFRKVIIAVGMVAEAIRTESPTVTNHVNRLTWAKQAFLDPIGKAEQMFPALMAQNSAATQAALLNATDAGIQTAVNNAVDVFATGS